MGNVDVSDKNSIILGRPIMKTSKIKIDIFADTLSMEFNGDAVNFKINDYELPSDNVSVNFVDISSPLLED